MELNVDHETFLNHTKRKLDIWKPYDFIDNRIVTKMEPRANGSRNNKNLWKIWLSKNNRALQTVAKSDAVCVSTEVKGTSLIATKHL